MRVAFILAACAGALLGCKHAGYATPSDRVEIALASSWRFQRADVAGAQAVSFDDSAWTPLSLPHTWNNIDGQMGGNAYYRGIGWYRRHVTVAPEHAGRRLFLQFDGAYQVTDVYVNGALVGEHRGGFARFRFDVTGRLQIGADNVIAVKVDNAPHDDVPPLGGDFTFFGGLYRDVRLVVTSPVHVSTMDFASSGVYLTPTHVSAAAADLRLVAKIKNDAASAQTATVSARVVDAGGVVVAALAGGATLPAAGDQDVVLTTRIANPHLWNGRADPHLYSVVVEVSLAGARVDRVTQPLGLRSFAIDANTGFMLNGRPYDLHGVNKHQDRLNVGWAISDADEDEDFGLMDELGVTAIRGCHYEHAQHFYDLADQRGITIWAELGNIGAENSSNAFLDNAKQQLTELIRQNYNHPSIFFWSVANEVTSQAIDPNPVLNALGALVKSEDPTRLSTLASTEIVSDLGHTDVIGFNKYFGWYGGTFADFPAWADAKHTAMPALPFSISEYGAGASINFHSDAPAKGDHTEEYQSLFHEAYFRAMKTRPYLWGKFVWNMFDFASSWRNEGDTPGRNDKGLVTYDRQTRKDAFYFYKANWNTNPFVYIASRRFTSRTQAATSIKVYGNVDSVAVTLNGTSLGAQNGIDGVFLWPTVTLAPGQNPIQAIGTRAGATYQDSVVWTLQ